MAGTRYTPDESKRMLHDFDQHVIGHPNIVAVREQVMSLVRLRAGAAACLVMGPTGVGKSTMVSRLTKAVDEEAASSGALGPAGIGHILFRAPQSINGSFPVTEFLTRGLLALSDPAMLAATGRAFGHTGWRGHRTVGELQRAFEHAVRERGPLAVIVDEANHLARVGGGERLISQMDFIKSLADATGALFVFVGTYDLTSMRNANGQLGRRLADIHFARYRPDGEGLSRFKRSIQSLIAALPIQGEGLLDDLTYVYKGSLGCVGIAKDWLSRALMAALEGQEPAVTVEHLRRTRLAADKMLKISREIVEGERALAGERDAEALVSEMLGLGSPPNSTSRRRPVVRTAPGHRKPKVRDRVGAAA